MGSSWSGSIPSKSWLVKVMGNMVHFRPMKLTECKLRMWRFLDEYVVPPPAKPLAIVLITPLEGEPCSLSLPTHRLGVLVLGRDSLRLRGFSNAFWRVHPSSLGLLTNCFKLPAWISSSIFSFRATHSSVV